MGYYFARSRGGLGQQQHLGPGETLADCPEPVATAERDALLNEIKGWTSPYAGPHWHEEHPDLKTIFGDVVNRLRGLEERPKLLRCEREARDRAVNWIGQLEALRRQVEKRGTTAVPGCQATTWVHITAPFPFTVYRGPTYTVRPGSTRPECFGGGPPPPSGRTQSDAPPGTVITGSGSGSGGELKTAPPPSMPVLTVGGGGGVWTPPAAYASDFMAGELVPGLPNRYLVYGALGLLAWRMVKGR